MIIQIYAFTKITEAIEAANLGVNHIGFVAGKYGIVHGELSFEEARQMAYSLPPQAKSVALTMATDIDEIIRMAQVVNPKIIHISTDPDAVDLPAMQIIRRRLPPYISLMKAIPVDDESSIELAIKFSSVCDIILLDSKVHGFPGVGATGHVHDWSISRRIVEASPIPVILAGGLGPDNVEKAINAAHPWGVDSNTATNIPGSPIEKDLIIISDFIAAIKKTEYNNKSL